MEYIDLPTLKGKVDNGRNNIEENTW